MIRESVTETPPKRRRRGGAGRSITIQDVARAANIAPSTASLALNGKAWVSDATRDAVLKAAQDLGYEPNYYAQRIKGGCSKTVALFSLDVSWGIDVAKIHRIQHELGVMGWHAPLHSLAFSTTEKAVELLSTLRRQKPLAIVASTVNLCPKTYAELQRYLDEGGKVVTYAYDLPHDLPCDQVIFDTMDNTYQGVTHLLQRGHRSIGLGVPGGLEPDNARVRGFTQALAEWGVEVQKEWLWAAYPNEQAGANFAEWYLAAKQKPTAMCIINDVAASTFLSHLTRAGVRVPQDLSIVSHDNTPTAEHALVPLTSVSHPAHNIADAVVALLKQQIENPDAAPQSVTVRGNLTVRDSTAPPL